MNIKELKKHINLKNIAISILIVASISVGALSIKMIISPKSSVATLVVVLSNDNRKFEGEVIGGMTILDTLIASSEAGEIGFRYFINEDNEVYIMEFDGYSHLPGVREIAFQLNYQKINAKDINKTLVRAGDEIIVGIERIE